MADINVSNIVSQKISVNSFTDNKVEVTVLRLDKIDPLISGNKWFKLRYYLQDAVEQHKKTILTFGGPWSNHILATAAACNINGLSSIGIIRGEEIQNLSPTLEQSKQLGMQLIFISRPDYCNKTIPPQLADSDYYFIDQGGYGIKGALGASTILDYCKIANYTHICCAVGTGTMMAGLINATLPEQEVIGISVLRNNVDLDADVRFLLSDKGKKIRIIDDYHFGGYAKYKPELIDFINQFYSKTNIPSDFVYTGKLFFAINDLIESKFFPVNSKVLIVHSGGLQGNVSLNERTLIF